MQVPNCEVNSHPDLELPRVSASGGNGALRRPLILLMLLIMIIHLGSSRRRSKDHEHDHDQEHEGAKLDASLGDPLDGEARDLPRILQIQLLFNMRAVRLDSLRAQVQRFRDRLHFFPGADHLEHFQFAIA